MIAFFLGVVTLQQQAALPKHSLGYLLATLFVLGVTLSIILRSNESVGTCSKWIFFSISLVLGFFYAAWRADIHTPLLLEKKLYKKDIMVTGTISSMVRRQSLYISQKKDSSHLNVQRFTFTVATARLVSTNQKLKIPRRLRLALYPHSVKKNTHIASGEKWRFIVRLKPPYGSANPYTFDYQKWLFSRAIGATGYIRKKAEKIAPSAPLNINTIRSNLSAHIDSLLPLNAYPLQGVLKALAIGMQSSITRDSWRTFTETGTNHLMAISGLHISLVGGFCALLIGALWRRLKYKGWMACLSYPVIKVRLIALLCAAFSYAFIAGFAIPAQRTVLMLSTVVLSFFLNRNISGFKRLTLALFVVLLYHPWAVLEAGFWLSFYAVTIIILWGEIQNNKTITITSNPLFKAAKWQLLISFALIVPTLFLFSQVSLISPIANFIAIPLISFAVVPLTLLGLILPDEISSVLLKVAYYILDKAYTALSFLQDNAPLNVWSIPTPPLWLTIVGIIATLFIILPRFSGYRKMGVLLLLPVVFWPPERPLNGSFRVTAFDIGQGSAALVETPNHRLLFDTGPKYSAVNDAAKSIILPYLKGRGITTLDTVILSHGDNDHIGGIKSILKSPLKINHILAGIKRKDPIYAHIDSKKNVTQCHEGKSWQWDGVRFTILYPKAQDYKQRIDRNQLSCTVLIENQKHRFLLSSDILKKNEKRIIKEAQQNSRNLKVNGLLVPHHGSKSSSSSNFINATQADIAVIQSGFLNRYQHPNSAVVKRYQNAGVTVLQANKEGMISLTFPNWCPQQKKKCFTTKLYKKRHWRYWWGEPNF